MQPQRLSTTLKPTLQLTLSILIYTFALPLFATWRTLLYLLLPTPLYAPALIHYTHTWNSLKSLSLMKPLVRYWTRVVALLFLLLQTIFSLTLLVKSSLFFIPWLASHINNTTSSEKQSHAARLNDLLFHITLFLASCAPFFSLLGTGVGILYYARKVWVYGRFQKRMVRNPGGRGYYMPEKKVKEGEGVMGSVANALQHLVHPQAVLVQGACEEGMEGYGVDIMFQQPGDASATGAQKEQSIAFVQKPEPAAKFDSNPYTWQGVMSIWSSKKSRYDGRDVRRRNFEEDMEMQDRAGGEQV
ncbi:hypothetical protein PtrSN002B_002349 [Pyrenophora tritici-repentis]|uniref:Uncharacterized protein n=1 Tax=Pyrenophora tritici-repentis TaxID=45151 RepID=A0A2W1FJJ6_9PLEO|nr:hypothetical protein PtrV1_09026 [Pyrenophora tritici-repentis]KAG9376787.1 hypothetical protein A1F94_012387 [Pyrenophora tritici-repentis]KAI0572856.1 hypothetical protein Alg130_10332 [Pyrenophora tritici-repentis]KAI0587843.1 hypothetical protein Alg215_01195 [Pyrenophora tritici-repentis]KAI0608859.1 hypothetical protein TUN205_06914 [Pyrenophora tritici-repentis]